MPLRTFSRDQAWLLPPALEELIPTTHPARFVAAFVDALERSAWDAMDIPVEGNPKGAPAYHPRALLAAWLYGFMTGVRSTRKLEQACRDSIPYLWLTGWQHPDHNTLWRFYEANREQLRKLLKRTVHVALGLGLIDLAIEAVDGTKIAANAARDRTLNAAGLQRVLDRVDAAIADLAAQNVSGGDGALPALPEELCEATALRERVEQAKRRLEDEERTQVNLTDGDARLVRSHPGIIVGYNAQAMVSPVRKGYDAGFLITAAAVTTEPNDQGQLAPMIQSARETIGQVAATVADAGYHSGPNLEACAALGQRIVMPEAASKHVLEDLYHKDRFVYEALTGTYRCPEGKTLRFIGAKHKRSIGVLRGYRAAAQDCLACPAFGRCTKNGRLGRRLDIRSTDQALRTHRAWMQTEGAKALYKLRKTLVEPAFGILKEQQGARRFLLRGLAHVRAEWSLLAVALNLRTLWKLTIGRRRTGGSGRWHEHPMTPPTTTGLVGIVP